MRKEKDRHKIALVPLEISGAETGEETQMWTEINDCLKSLIKLKQVI